MSRCECTEPNVAAAVQVEDHAIVRDFRRGDPFRAHAARIDLLRFCADARLHAAEEIIPSLSHLLDRGVRTPRRERRRDVFDDGIEL
jgi:hypothetical protein